MQPSVQEQISHSLNLVRVGQHKLSEVISNSASNPEYYQGIAERFNVLEAQLNGGNILSGTQSGVLRTIDEHLTNISSSMTNLNQLDENLRDLRAAGAITSPAPTSGGVPGATSAPTNTTVGISTTTTTTATSTATTGTASTPRTLEDRFTAIRAILTNLTAHVTGREASYQGIPEYLLTLAQRIGSGGSLTSAELENLDEIELHLQNLASTAMDPYLLNHLLASLETKGIVAPAPVITATTTTTATTIPSTTATTATSTPIPTTTTTTTATLTPTTATSGSAPLPSTAPTVVTTIVTPTLGSTPGSTTPPGYVPPPLPVGRTPTTTAAPSGPTLGEKVSTWAQEVKNAITGGAASFTQKVAKAFASEHKAISEMFENAEKEVKRHADSRGTSPSARAEALQQTISANLYNMLSSIPQDVSTLNDPQRATLKAEQQKFVAAVTSSALDLQYSGVYNHKSVPLLKSHKLKIADIAPNNLAKLNTGTTALLDHTAPTNTEYASSYSSLERSHEQAFNTIQRTRMRANLIHSHADLVTKTAAEQEALATLNPTDDLKAEWANKTAAQLRTALDAGKIEGEITTLTAQIGAILGNSASDIANRTPILEQRDARRRITQERRDILVNAAAAREAHTAAKEAADDVSLTLFPKNSVTLVTEYAVLKQARDTIQKQTHGDKKDRERQVEIIDDAMYMNLLLQREICLQKQATAQTYINSLGEREENKRPLQAALDAEKAIKDLVAEYMLNTATLGKFASARTSERLAAGLVGTFSALAAVAGGWAATATIPGLVQGGSMAAAEAAAKEAFTNPASVWEKLRGLIASNQPIAGMDPSLFVSLLVVGSIVGAAVFTAAITKFAHDIEQGKQSGKLLDDANTRQLITAFKTACEHAAAEYTAKHAKAVNEAAAASRTPGGGGSGGVVGGATS